MDHLDELGEGEIEVRNHVQISGPGRIAISLKKTNIQEKNRNSVKNDCVFRQVEFELLA